MSRRSKEIEFAEIDAKMWMPLTHSLPMKELQFAVDQLQKAFRVYAIQRASDETPPGSLKSWVEASPIEGEVRVWTVRPKGWSDEFDRALSNRGALVIWCSGCMKAKNSDRFHKDENRHNGHQSLCKDCKKKIRLKDKQKQKATKEEKE